MIQLVAECWAALAVDWGCLWGTERVWVLPSRWMNGPSGQSSVSGSHRPEILLAGSQQTSKQWCLCADPGPLGGQNSFDSTGQQGGGTKAAHDQCPPDFGSVCHLQFVFLVHNRKDNTFIKVEFFFFFAFFNYISFFKTPLAFFMWLFIHTESADYLCCSCQRSFCGFEMEEVPDSDCSLRTSWALPLVSHLCSDVFSVLCILGKSCQSLWLCIPSKGSRCCLCNFAVFFFFF